MTKSATPSLKIMDDDRDSRGAKSTNERDSKKENKIKMGYFGSLLELDQSKHLGTPKGIRRTKKIILKGTSDEAKLSVQQLTKPTDNILEVDKDLL